MTKVFIDGSAGTTGLRIVERLSTRDDLSLIILSDELRKDADAKRDAFNEADIALMCLPDAAAKEDVALVTNPDTVVIDTSTAHRTKEGWLYGFPEIGGRKKLTASAKRIANPGCHASGFVSLIAPLTECGILKKDAALSCFSLTGYSGGGKKMIAEYEADEMPAGYDAPRMYGITQQHKHLPEMAAVCSLETLPVFCPVVASYYSGMQVTVPVFSKDIKGTINDIKEIYKTYYKDGLVKYIDDADENGFMSAGGLSGRDDMEISVFGNDDRIILVSRFDNLGKGASGSAIQNMNIVMGIDEKTGLTVL